MMASEITFRPFAPSDIPFAMKLKNRAGWNQIEADWERFVAFEPEGCLMALLDGEPAGTVTTIRYDPKRVSRPR